MKNKRYTPLSLIKATERVSRSTSNNKCEGLTLAVVRMISQHKNIPKSEKKLYSNNWAYVVMQIWRQKYREDKT